MSLFAEKFTAFINAALKILLLLIIGTSFIIIWGMVNSYYGINLIYFMLVNLSLLLVTFIYAYIIYSGLKRKWRSTVLLSAILIITFLLRLMWILSIDTVPVSDFRVLYEYGGLFIKGDYSMFKGIGYVGRFPHLTLSVIYYGIFHRFFSNPLMAIKIVNVILSTVSVLLIYLIIQKLYENKSKAIWSAFTASLFPPFIIYTSVTCTENHAMPFFLGSIYFFLKVVKDKNKMEWMLLSGVFLIIGHVFRMVGIIILIAYIMYIIIYVPLKKSFKSSIYILAPYFIVYYILNTVLLSSGITEYPLWKGRESNITSVLRGTNIKSNGAWNEEDAQIAEKYNYDYDAVSNAAKTIIIERLTTTPPLKLFKFYIRKFTSEWGYGDFGALYWSTIEVKDKNFIYKLSSFVGLYSQVFYSILIVTIYIGIFNKKQYKINKSINLFYIIFCGFGLLYLITENQTRYGYIVSWLFIILAFSCDNISFIKSKLKFR